MQPQPWSVREVLEVLCVVLFGMAGATVASAGIGYIVFYLTHVTRNEGTAALLGFVVLGCSVGVVTCCHAWLSGAEHPCSAPSACCHDAACICPRDTYHVFVFGQPPPALDRPVTPCHAHPRTCIAPSQASVGGATSAPPVRRPEVCDETTTLTVETHPRYSGRQLPHEQPNEQPEALEGAQAKEGTLRPDTLRTDDAPLLVPPRVPAPSGGWPAGLDSPPATHRADGYGSTA